MRQFHDLEGGAQAQFYNTFVSSDGVTWSIPEGACALTDVDVQAAIAYRFGVWRLGFGIWG